MWQVPDKSLIVHKATYDRGTRALYVRFTWKGTWFPWKEIEYGYYPDLWIMWNYDFAIQPLKTYPPGTYEETIQRADSLELLEFVTAGGPIVLSIPVSEIPSEEVPAKPIWPWVIGGIAILGLIALVGKKKK